MQVKLRVDRRGTPAGTVLDVAEYEGRRLIEQGLGEDVTHPLDHDGDGRKGGMRGRRKPRTGSEAGTAGAGQEQAS